MYGATFIVIFLIVTAYASYLAFQVRGAPDQMMMRMFANQYALWLVQISLVLFTLLGTRWLASFVKTELELHGLTLGGLVALVNLIIEDMMVFSLTALFTTLLIVGAG